MNINSRAKAIGTVLVVLTILFSNARPLRSQPTNESDRPEKKKVFAFEGGSPLDFIVALDRHFRTRLVQILTLPETLSRTRVPKLRVAADDPKEVLSVYNRLGSPALGQWHCEPDGSSSSTNLSALVLVPDKSAAAAKLDRNVTKVRAFALAGVPEAKWDTIARSIEEVKDYSIRAAEQGTGEVLMGTVRFQRDSKVLIAFGPEPFIELVESLLSAHRQNAEFEAKARLEEKSGQPAKADK